MQWNRCAPLAASLSRYLHVSHRIINHSPYLRTVAGSNGLLQARPTGSNNLLQIRPVIFTQTASFLKVTSEDFPKRLPDKGVLVYVGTLANQVKLVKAFSLSTSLMTILIQPFIYKQLSALPVALQFVVSSSCGLFILMTPLLLHWITKRYVTTMYFHRDEEEFTATTYNFLLQKVEHKFTKNTVVVPQVPGLLTTVVANGKPLYCDPSLFLSKEAYMKLMKYDEPMDWGTPEVDSKETQDAQEKKG